MEAFRLYNHQHPGRAPAPPQTATIASLPRISKEALAARLLDVPNDPKLAIIDVRDSDYIGGHILGCTNITSSSLDYKLPELVRTLKDKNTVIFHCALSQQRGPGAALRYLRARESLGGVKNEKKSVDETKEGETEGEATSVEEQKVYVLEGGFQEWQEK